MLHIINNIQLIDNQTETHYRFHTQLDLSQYPQVHDFYEIVLVTSGTLSLTLCKTPFSLSTGSMAFIRPGDIHSKSGHNCSHINLAFPPSVVDALFKYLCDDSHYETIKLLPYVPPIHLGQSELFSLKNRMIQLNIIPSSEYQKIRTNLRRILFEVITLHFLPSIEPNHSNNRCPSWLSQALTRWNSDEHRGEGLDFFCNMTGYSKEHICRTFKRCLGLTPTAYLNEQRLNYAVNLLIHTDYSITDISYESGFASPSRFYQLFHKAYGVSPKNFLQQGSSSTQIPL